MLVFVGWRCQGNVPILEALYDAIVTFNEIGRVQTLEGLGKGLWVEKWILEPALVRNSRQRVWEKTEYVDPEDKQKSIVRI